MIKLLQINKYRVDFAEFTVAWVISNRANGAKSARINITWITQILAILPLGIQNLEKFVRKVQISRSSGQGLANCVGFVQFAVNFESSIYPGVKRKMVCEFCFICVNCGLFGYFGGVLGCFNYAYVHEWCGFCVIYNLK